MIHDIRDDYFWWLFGLVCENKHASHISFERLLRRLHDTDFRWIIPNDRNRAEEGAYLRYRFALTQGSGVIADEIVEDLDGPCSVFELMVGVAIHCEEHIMDDPTIGNRTGQWFWNMIVNMGLGAMTDEKYNARAVVDILDRFMDREYEPDGKGGLFRIRNCKQDLRDVEIFHQMCWYIDTIM